MAEKDYTLLAKELRSRLPEPSLPTMEVRVWGDNEEGYIYCAPATEGLFGRAGYILYVEEIVLFAQYHGLSVHTCAFETGAGLSLS